MKVYAALLIDGAEDGPRIPCKISFEQLSGGEELKVRLHKAVSVGPSSQGGVATMRLFTDDGATNDYILDVKIGEIPVSSSVHYTPDTP